MKILKFGGTSVGRPDRMRKVAKIVTGDDLPKIVVLSALSGTTNSLVEIGLQLRNKKLQEAKKIIESLCDHYLRFVDELYQNEPSRSRAVKMINKHFDFMRSLIQKEFNDVDEKALLAQGELMSTHMFHYYLQEQNFHSEMLPALEFMAINEDDEPDFDYIKVSLNDLISKNPNGNLFITQGYICLNSEKQIDNLKRGGSDFTATLLGAALSAEKVEIWTDIDGMHNNDPRVVDKTFPIADLSFNEASELAYFGAKILHPSSIIPVKEYKVKVQLKNTMAPDAPGTTISSIEKEKEIKAIAAKDGITAIRIKSTRMLLAYGFLRRVFEVFEKYKTPIDMITTSEVAVSLTIDNDKYLSEIVEELNVFGEVMIDRSQTIICIVGNRIAEIKGIVPRIFSSIEQVPVRMISYGGSKYNVSVLVDTQYKIEALKGLNLGLFDL
jgi:aspartate kinase